MIMTIESSSLPTTGSDWPLIVIGAGAAGMIAAARAAHLGVRTLLLEKNTKVGVKILISGGTRCNLTHAAEPAEMLSTFDKRQARFLRNAFFAFPPHEVVEHFRRLGVPTKTEDTGKIFPRSDRALDVQQALLNDLRKAEVVIKLSSPVQSIRRHPGAERFEIETSQNTYRAEYLLVTTGGKSYPGCGTTGDGYGWLESFGHTITPPRPALVPLVASASWIAELSGLTIEDALVRVTPAPVLASASAPDQVVAIARKHQLRERRSALLFTHFGFSGPAAMDISGTITAEPNPLDLRLVCDFLPHTEVAELSAHIHHQVRSQGQRSVGRLLQELLPSRLGQAIASLADVPADRRLAELTKRDLKSLMALIKANPIAVSGSRGYAKAEVTAGGLSLNEVHPKTMQSKQVPGLFVAGELLDVDGRIGGYNFQAAFSTGWLAATHIATALQGRAE